MVSVEANEVELSDGEVGALVDLVRLVVDLDDDTSPDESDEMALIAKQVGDDRFWDAMQRTKGSEPTVEGCAAAVERRPAQELILSLLEELAEADGVASAEGELLEKLRHIWSIED